VAKCQSGQVDDDRSLSVPQLNATAMGDGFENYWVSDTFRDETSHILAKRRMLSLEQYFRVRAFLKKQRRSRS
jgi:hypothetical protein